MESSSEERFNFFISVLILIFAIWQNEYSNVVIIGGAVLVAGMALVNMITKTKGILTKTDYEQMNRDEKNDPVLEKTEFLKKNIRKKT